MDRGELDLAQQLLSHVDDSVATGPAVSYLTTRLLFLRGKLDALAVADRLQAVVAQVPDFHEARTLLRATAGSRPQPSFVDSAAKRATPANGSQRAVERNDPPSAKAPTYDGPPSQSITPHADLVAPLLESDLASPDELDRMGIPPTTPDLSPDRRIEVDTRAVRSSPPRQSQLPGRWGNSRLSSRPAGRYSASQPPPREASRRPRVPNAPRLPSLDPPIPAPVDTRAAADRDELARRPTVRLESELALWTPTEVALYDGHPGVVLMDAERAAEEQFSQLGTHPSPEDMAHGGAAFLSAAPVSRLFCPYDFSLHSLERVAAVLELLGGPHGSSVRAPNVVRLIGAYLGETLRLCHRAAWRGEWVGLDEALAVAGDNHNWEPFRLVSRRLQTGSSAALIPALSVGLARPGTQAWFHHRSAPPEPLIDLKLNVELLPQLGGALPSSPYGVYCRDVLRQPLDFSPKSSTALATLFSMLTASATSLRSSNPWLQDLCLIFGAHVGELLRGQRGGQWEIEESDAPLKQYCLRSEDAQTHPAWELIQHAICGQPGELSNFVQRSLATR